MLTEVEVFEHYLQTKCLAAKRFSIEGGDGFILALNKAIATATNFKVEEVIIGMAHRGRLCTLAQVMNKPYRAILSEFIGNSSLAGNLAIAGDVKYHLGYSTDKILANGHKVHLSLAYNPSHLESINAVVAGRVRAKQDLINDRERKKVLGILIHGDAAFCGQGVVAKCSMMSSLDAYNVEGILHFIVNNQIGFTTNSDDIKSGRYVTEIAKIIKAPIIHVNGDDAEAILLATNNAINYWHKFGKDVVVDIICYRKYGHNEGDEPLYTQSSMYKLIKTKKLPAQIYANQLAVNGIIDYQYFTELREQLKGKLDQEYNLAKTYLPQVQAFKGLWSDYSGANSSLTVTTTKVLTGLY